MAEVLQKGSLPAERWTTGVLDSGQQLKNWNMGKRANKSKGSLTQW